MKKDYIYIAIIVLLAIAGIVIYGAYDDKRNEAKSLLSASSEKDAKVEKLTNALGEEIYRKQAAEVRIKDLEKSYPELAATLEKQFDIKVKNLKAYIENQFQVHGTGTGTIINNNYGYDSATKTASDSLKYSVPNDKYLKFNVSFKVSFKDKFTFTQSPYTYTYSDTVKTVIASNKKFFQFWKNEKLYATTKFGNQNSQITGATNILVNDFKDKRFSVSLSVGYGLLKVKDEIHTGFFIGPSVSYSLFKF